MRFQRINTCKECSQHSTTCNGKNLCNPARQKLRTYNGIRFTADGFDCALPVTIDSHSVCSFGCKYCFAQNLMSLREKNMKPIGQTSLKKIDRIFSGKDQSKDANLIRQALKYNNKKNGYPCPIQLEGVCDPLDNIERQQGWFLKFVELCKKYNQPCKISTKGNLFLEEEYLDALKDRPELFYVMYSIITVDDKIIKKVEPRSPTATERIQCLKNLNDINVKTALRFRPILPGISDATKKHPKAYKELIQKCAEAGVNSISYEVAFLPGRMTNEVKKKWQQIEKISGKPLISIYKSMGKNEACFRPSYKWTEQIMIAIYNEAKKYNLDIGVSDPLWKELTECGCCCGLKESDPIFGNFQTESCTNQLMLAKQTGKILKSEDIIPDWSKNCLKEKLANPGVGPTVRYKRKHETWADNLRRIWNEIERERSPYNYFQGVLIPCKKEGEEIYYKYKGLPRSNPKKTPFWNIEPIEEE